MGGDLRCSNAFFRIFPFKLELSAPIRTGMAEFRHKNWIRRHREDGFVILATAISIFILFGMLGLAVDLGRLFILKSEAQAFADTAAIDGVRMLNGKTSGIEAAKTAILGSKNRINFNTSSVPENLTTVEFAKSAVGPWETDLIGSAAGYAFIRVTVKPQMKLLLISAIQNSSTASVSGQAVAAQAAKTFPKGGYMPFTPYSLTSGDATGNFGMSPGQEYAFIWPGNAKKQDVCAGNQVNWPAYDFSDNSQAQGSERGYFEFNSASEIADAIMGGKQTSPLAIGDVVPMSNGRKQSTNKILEDRAALDTDLTSYAANGSGSAPAYHGNGMRLVTMPINSGAQTSPANKVVGFGAFLLPLSYPNGGNKTWCAIYMGSSVGGGATSAYLGAGAYEVRLVL